MAGLHHEANEGHALPVLIVLLTLSSVCGNETAALEQKTDRAWGPASAERKTSEGL